MNTDKSDIYAKALFDSDRTCCVCRDHARKHLQIHHIDSNHANDDPDNLSVLCLECHADTLLKGGFSRHLSSREVKLFRDDWLALVHNEKRSKPVKQDIPPSLGFDVKEEPIHSFVKQLEDLRILPTGITYHFRDYYFITPGFPTIVVDANDLGSDNGEKYKSILKAYLLCVLGAIAPQGMLTTDTPTPSQSINSVRIGDVLIAVPRWLIMGFEELGHLHLTGQYEQHSNQILLTLAPMIQTAGINYDVLGIKLEKIALMLKGKNLLV